MGGPTGDHAESSRASYRGLIAGSGGLRVEVDWRKLTYSYLRLNWNWCKQKPLVTFSRIHSAGKPNLLLSRKSSTHRLYSYWFWSGLRSTVAKTAGRPEARCVKAWSIWRSCCKTEGEIKTLKRCAWHSILTLSLQAEAVTSVGWNWTFKCQKCQCLTWNLLMLILKATAPWHLNTTIKNPVSQTSQCWFNIEFWWWPGFYP